MENKYIHFVKRLGVRYADYFKICIPGYIATMIALFVVIAFNITNIRDTYGSVTMVFMWITGLFLVLPLFNVLFDLYKAFEHAYNDGKPQPEKSKEPWNIKIFDEPEQKEAEPQKSAEQSTRNPIFEREQPMLKDVVWLHNVSDDQLAEITKTPLLNNFVVSTGNDLPDNIAEHVDLRLYGEPFTIENLNKLGGYVENIYLGGQYHKNDVAAVRSVYNVVTDELPYKEIDSE